MKHKLKIKKSNIKDIKAGSGCEIIEPVNLYGCKFGKKVFIGPFVEIQNKTFIDDFTRISSHTFICSLVEIGKNCFVGHGVFFTNDKWKNGKRGNRNPKNWSKTKVGNNVLIGSNATILPVKICSNVVIGAGSVVTKNINKPGIYYGNPAKFFKKI